jgi:cell division septal protein FtsQ
MDSYDDLTTHSSRGSGSQMLLEASDPEAVLLSIVDDQLVISIPEAAARPSLLPEDYIAVADRPRHDDDGAASIGGASPSPMATHPERRSIARAQARSAGSWTNSHLPSERSQPQYPAQLSPAQLSAAQLSATDARATEPQMITARSHDDNVIIDERLLRRADEIRYEKSRRRRHRMGRLLIVSVMAAIVGAALYNSAVIRVTKVNVVGNADMSDDNIIQALAVSDEPSMFAVKVADLRQRLLALPLIADARIWKKWPNTLEVQVIERFGVATVSSPTGWLIVDQQGIVLDRRAQRPLLPVLLIDGNEIDESTVTAGPVPNPALAPALLALSSAPSKLTVLVNAVSVTNGEVALSMRRSADPTDHTTDPATDSTAPATARRSGKTPQMIQVNFGRAVDIAAKWKAIDTLRDRVDLAKFAVLDVSVAGQPALIPAVSSIPPTTTVGGN